MRKQEFKLAALLLLFFGCGLAAAQFGLRVRVGHPIYAGPPPQGPAWTSGLIVFVASGACPSGFTELAGFNGKTIFGTLNANADVGGTGGSDSITPTTASVDQPTIAWPMGVPTNSSITISGSPASEVTGVTVDNHASHTHTYTEVPNHVHLQTVMSTASGGGSGAVRDTSSNNAVADAQSTQTNTGGVATATTAGPSATLTHTVNDSGHSHGAGTLAASTPTISWPAGVPTASGSAVTLNQFDNRSAFLKLIACEAD